MRRLQRHVDVPVVLPTSVPAGLPDLRGWYADPKYLGWENVDGVRTGSLKIRKGEQLLILSYGLSTFDGCGDRTSAEEVEVLGQPALLSEAREHVWSTVLWPVTATGSIGRYGISGTFDGESMLRLAESIERERLHALGAVKHC